MSSPSMFLRPTPTPVVDAQPGCWSNFVNGASSTVNWCGRQISTAAVATWNGIRKVAVLTAAFFQRLAFYCGVGIAAAITFVKDHSREFAVGGIALASGLLLGLLFSRCFGCCNKPVAKGDEARSTSPSDDEFENSDHFPVDPQNTAGPSGHPAGPNWRTSRNEEKRDD